MLVDGVYFEPTSGASLAFDSDYLRNCNVAVARVIAGIPRFVKEEYAEDFGSQWNFFPRTQLDSKSGLSLSYQRLERCVGHSLTMLKGKLVLEAGSGAGRFTEVLLSSGAVVHSFDKSSAVEVNAANNNHFDNFALAQADILRMPYKNNCYDLVVCLGVLQHTPSPEDSILQLWSKVKPGGSLVFDHYPRNWRVCAPWPLGEILPLYRYCLLRTPKRLRLKLISKIVSFWFPVHWFFRSFSIVQKILRRISPLIVHFDSVPLKTKEDFFNWAFLDTHDATTDFFKHRRSLAELNQFLRCNLTFDTLHLAEGGNGIEVRVTKSTET